MLDDYEVHLRLYSRDGQLKEPYIEPLAARWTHTLDGDEPITWTVEAGNPTAGGVAEYDLAEVMLRNKSLGIVAPDGGFVRDGVGIVRGWQIETGDDGVTLYTFRAPEQKHILNWRPVLYRAGVTGSSRFSNVPAETIIKTLVAQNCTAAATTGNGRLLPGDLADMATSIVIETDQGRGGSLSPSLAYGLILNIWQRLRPRAGGDIALEWQGGAAEGGHYWTLSFHAPHLGDDWSSGPGRVVFSLENFTMLRPRLVYQPAAATAVVVGGRAGDDGLRIFETVLGPDWAADNDLQGFVDARDLSLASSLQDRGLERVTADETRARERLEFDVAQTADVFYSPVGVAGRATYRLGDLVLAAYAGREQVHKIKAVVLDWQLRGERSPLQIQVETDEVVA
jgi:hypothetical protein